MTEQEGVELLLAEVVRGAAWPGTGEAPYPRADPTDASRLPIDTWGTAQLPVGVRIELTGSAAAVEIDYRCHTDDLGYRGVGAGTSFTVWKGDQQLAEADVVLGQATVRLALGGTDGGVTVVHVPEGMRPELLAVRAIDGSLEPAPRGPRWLAYGDSITEGWVATGPGGAWPAVAARRHGLDVVNLGYAGAARGEIASAEQIAKLPADVITVAYGTNCWSRTPHSAELLRAGYDAFLDVLRFGHPTTPIVVVSPILRPDAEGTPNLLGATHADLREAVEHVVTGRMEHDPHLSLVRGAELVAPEQLPDGIHPDDVGHRSIASAVGPAVVAALASPPAS